MLVDKRVYENDESKEIYKYLDTHTLVRIERIFGLPIFSEAPFGDDFLVIKGVGSTYIIYCTISNTLLAIILSELVHSAKTRTCIAAGPA
eukprot:SAG22_NODE_727_length_7598_cov_89.922523_7_plen_90_part_00